MKLIVILILFVPIGIFGLALWIVKLIYLIFPASVLFLLGYHLTATTFTQAPTREEYQLLFGVVGLLAALSGLTLRIASLCESKKQRDSYLENGEELFFGTLYFVFGLGLRYAYSIVTWKLPEVSFVQTTLQIFGVLAYYSALYFASSALVGLGVLVAERNPSPPYQLLLRTGRIGSKIVRWLEKLAIPRNGEKK